MLSSRIPNVIMLVGLQGSGKTTAAVKLAYMLKKQGKSPLLAACDVYRPAAADQLATLGGEIGVPVFRGDGAHPVEIARASIREAVDTMRDVVIVDTAGRLQIDEQMMQEAVDIKKAVKPDQVLMVVDAMTGQDIVNVVDVYKRQRRKSSIVLGCRAVKKGQAGGFFSAGSTGAVTAAGTAYVTPFKASLEGRRTAIRPCLTNALPNRAGGLTVLCDMGANPDVEPLDAVSYTHLDVYKRQLGARPLAEGGAPSGSGDPSSDAPDAQAAAGQLPSVMGETIDMKDIRTLVQVGVMSVDELVAARGSLMDALGDSGETIVTSQAIEFVKRAYENAGIDLGAVQTDYLIREGAIMLGYALVAALCAIAAAYNASRTAAKVAREDVYKRQLRVGAEAAGDPVEDHADARLVAAVDEVHELLRRAVARRGGEVSGRLIAPRPVEGMLHEGHDLDVRVAHLLDVRHQLIGEVVVRVVGAALGGEGIAGARPGAIFARLSLRFVSVALPGAQMHLVDVEGALHDVALRAATQPGSILPGVAGDVP